VTFKGIFGAVQNSTFVRFAIVGGLGAITNLAIFYLLVDVLHKDPTLVSISTFIFSLTQNYFLNHAWTFRKTLGGERISLIRYLKYFGSSLFGLAVNIGTLNLMFAIHSFKTKVLAQALGILLGLVVNYIGSKYLAFKKKGS